MVRVPHPPDEARSGGPDLRLILCGSALSVMSTLLSGSRALHGRAALDLSLAPLDYRQARDFWGVELLDLAFQLHAIVGGTPGYPDLVQGSSPRTAQGLEPWLAASLLNPSHTLFREPEYFLAEEPAITDRSLYQSVLGAIGTGKRTSAALAAALGRPEGAVRHPLAVLVRAGFVLRDEDMLLRRRPTLRLADPLLRFHHVVVRPNLARLELRQADQVWRDATATVAAQVMGPHFEELARDRVRRFAAPSTIGGGPVSVGRTVVNDPAGKACHEVDIVALAGDGRTVTLLGAAKGGLHRVDLGELERLDAIRHLLAAAGRADVSNARLALFARGGFHAEVRRAAQRRPEVELVDLERLDGGE